MIDYEWREDSQGKQLVYKSINVHHHINELKNKQHIITSINAEKLLEKIQHSLLYELRKVVIRSHTPNIALYVTSHS